MSENETVNVLKDIKKILSMICLFNIRSLKKELLLTETDQKIYDKCEKTSADQIADDLKDVGFDAVYNRVYDWEKQGLITSEEIAQGRGRPKKYYIKIEDMLK